MTEDNLPPLERMLQGAARRVGSGAVHPFEVRDRVLEAFEQSIAGNDVANSFTVALHPLDIRALAPALGGLRLDIERSVRQRMRERGLRMVHDLLLHFVPDATVAKGTVRVSHRFAHAVAAAGPSGPTRRLEPLRGMRIRLEGGEVVDVPYLPFTIGRASDNDLVLASFSLSRQHAELVHGEAGIELRDRASANGIHVDGQRRDSVPVRSGTVVTVGDVVLRFERDG